VLFKEDERPRNIYSAGQIIVMDLWEPCGSHIGAGGRWKGLEKIRGILSSSVLAYWPESEKSTRYWICTQFKSSWKLRRDRQDFENAKPAAIEEGFQLELYDPYQCQCHQLASILGVEVNAHADYGKFIVSL
jgi:hypothetical protein